MWQVPTQLWWSLRAPTACPSEHRRAPGPPTLHLAISLLLSTDLELSSSSLQMLLPF